MDTPLEFLVGLAAAVSTIASLLPQLLEEESRALLKEVYLLMVAGFALWVVHGVMVENAAVVLFGASGLACCALSLTLRFRSFVRSWW